MFEAVPAPPPVIFVQEVRSNEPAMLLGFMAVGPEADMARLETRATNLKFPAGRATNDKNEPEVMVMFPPGTDHSAGLQLYREVLAGKFGKLKLEVVIITKEKAQDGIDMDKDPSAVDPSSIRIPNR
jgi:hypothetical protein